MLMASLKGNKTLEVGCIGKNGIRTDCMFVSVNKLDRRKLKLGGHSSTLVGSDAVVGVNVFFLLLRPSLEGKKPLEVGLIDKDMTRTKQQRQKLL